MTPRFAHGREDSRARADDDARLAALQASPLVEALARGQRRVEDGDGVAEVRAQAAREDGRQSDFGDEHHRRPPAPQSLAHGADVDFGLAAARDAVQEEGAVAARTLRLVDFVQSRLLRVGQLQLVPLGQARAGQRVAPHVAHEDFEQPAPLKRLDGRGACRGGFEQLGEEHLAALALQRLDDLHLRRRQRAFSVSAASFIKGVAVRILVFGKQADCLPPLGARLCAPLFVRDRDPARARQLARGLCGARLTQLARCLAQSGRAVGVGGGHLQQTPLGSRGAAFGQTRQLVAPFRRDAHDLIDARVEPRGQRRLQHLAPRRGVVVAYPARYLQHLGRQQGLRIEQLLGILYL